MSEHSPLLGAVADDAAFPTLDPAQVEFLDSIGERQAIHVGEYLYRSGDESYDFFVLLSGAVAAVIDGDDGEEVVVAQRDAGRFLGELNLITGQRVYVSTRVIEDGEVIRVSADDLRTVIATNARLGDVVLTAFMARREALLRGAGSTVRVLGSRYQAETHAVLEFLTRSHIPHEWVDPERDDVFERLVRELDLAHDDLPAVVTSSAVLRRATPGAVAEHLGLTVGRLPDRCFDLVVVGSGPAGLAASVYGASEGLRTLALDTFAPGGQAGTSSRIENYLGFPTGISGGDLAQRALVQAEKFGAHLSSPCAATAMREESGHLVVSLVDGSEVAGRAVIVATGANYRRLPVDGLERFEGNGVYYAATETEARACGAEPVVVVGGGNSAGQAAVFLAENGNHVTVVVRKPDLGASMSRYLVDRICAQPNVTVRASSTVAALDGDTSLRRIRIDDPDGGCELACGALFSFIGADPATGWLSRCAALDDHGFVLTDRALDPAQLGEQWELLGRPPLPYETNHPGLFAVGDVRSGSTKRVAAAVGEGSAAVRSVHEFLAFGQ
jgi:thioredoxin reductase (NADPH)